MAIEIRIRLSKREAEALLRADISAGHGRRMSQALQMAAFKVWEAIIRESTPTSPQIDSEATSVSLAPATRETATNALDNEQETK